MITECLQAPEVQICPQDAAPDEAPPHCMRVAWEYNGDWFHYNAIGKKKDFIGAWQQMVTVFRKESDRFRFDWCPTAGDGYPMMNPEDAYPGDEFVDVIGLDVYDEKKWSHIEDERARWKQIEEVPYGLEWHRGLREETRQTHVIPGMGLRRE